MTQNILWYIAGGAYLLAILMMLKNGFGNQSDVSFGFVTFLVIATLSAILGNVINTESSDM